MYLKKLALSGFKTFAQSTTLELGPGLTAIVGPNGSGKSNLVDAMLWALGERSHKSLRATTSTDVIFGGSSDGKASGMAEVSLFFDNENRALPLDFGEVQVTRRLFRDGDAQYAINKPNCRLRDVTDLFLDTGIGPNAYSIVSQSEIDAILSAKPEDRRNLLESAAGVQKYRARRNETQRKLERVDADLTRVFDITSELETQLQPLEIQAQAAREYDELLARLKYLQLALLAREYDIRLKRVQTLEESKEANTNAVLAGLGAIEELEKSEAALEARLRELESAMDALQTEGTQNITRLKSTEGELAVARERRRALTEQQEFLAQEIGLLRARIATAQENAATQKRELEQTLSASASLSNDAAQAEALMGGANARLQEATRELQWLQAQVIETMREGQARREAFATGRAETANLQHRIGELEALVHGLENERAQVLAAREKANADLVQSKAAAQDAGAKIEQARLQVLAAQQEREESAKTQNGRRENRARLQSRLGALRELEENLEGVQGGARAVLGAIKRGQIDADFLLVADAMRAPQVLETAIEIALGAQVHNLICARDVQAKNAIHWLKENRAGRATFLPLDSLRPSGAGERTRGILHESGVRGVASELVECDEENRKAIEYLLGRVVVVDDLDTATRLARRCDMGARLVTLDGDLVLPAGAITGGQGKQKTSGLLARKRELDELDAHIETIQSEIQSDESTLKSAQEKIEAAQVLVRDEQERANDLRAQIARQERENEHLDRELRRIKGNYDAANHQLNQARESLAAKSSKQGAHENQAQSAENRAAELEAQVLGAQNVVAKLSVERENIGQSVSQVRADYSASQERLGAMRRAIAEIERGVVEAQGQVRSRQDGIARAAREDGQILGDEAMQVALLSQLQARREELETRTSQGRAERANVIANLEKSGAELKLSRAQLHESEDELHRVEVRLASTSAEIVEMERRLREEFAVEPEIALERRDDIEHKGAAIEEIGELSGKIAALGPVNVGAIVQHEQVRERLEFLTAQRDDLQGAKGELEAIIADIDARTRTQFLQTFETVRVHFDELFKRVFDGGQTHLSLTQPENLLETGIELRVQPPGKGAQDIALLSGGERALTALTFMLALLKTHPSPFVVLDEVDAPLDQSNVGRFTQLLREFTGQTQFIVITHNNGTMQAADVLYGVTMQKQGISTVMSVRLVDDVETARDDINARAQQRRAPVLNGVE